MNNMILPMAVVLVSLIVLTICMVLTQIQLMRMARAWEILAQNIDGEVKKVGRVTNLFGETLVYLRGAGPAKVVAFVAGMVGGIFERRGQNNGSRRPADQEKEKFRSDKR